MWEQYRGYNKKNQHHTSSVAVVLENVLGCVGHNNNSSPSSTKEAIHQHHLQQHQLVGNGGTGTLLSELVDVDEKYVPKTIIRRDYNGGHNNGLSFTVYITSHAYHPQAFTAQCGTTLIDTMKGRDVMFKYFENQDENQLLSSILGTGTSSATGTGTAAATAITIHLEFGYNLRFQSI